MMKRTRAKILTKNDKEMKTVQYVSTTGQKREKRNKEREKERQNGRKTINSS